MGKRDFMITATKEITFDCAHIVAGHKGLCRNLHGHTYKVQVTAQRDELIEEGSSEAMVIDFKDLKLAMGQVFDKYDHAFVVNNDAIEADESAERYAAERAVFAVVQQHGLRHVIFPGRATAERMSAVFLEQLNGVLAIMGSTATISEVKVWETPTSFATATRG